MIEKLTTVLLFILLIISGLVLCLNIYSTNEQSEEDVIKKAREYSPNKGCLDVITPAIHKESGAKYSFPSSCTPPGWEPNY